LWLPSWGAAAMAMRPPFQQTFGSPLAHCPPVAMAQLVAPGSPTLPVARSVQVVSKQGHSMVGSSVPVIVPKSIPAAQPTPSFHPLQPLVSSKSVDRLFRPSAVVVPADSAAVRSWAPIPGTPPYSYALTPQKTKVSPALRVPDSNFSQTPASVVSAPRSSTRSEAFATPANSAHGGEEVRRGRLGSLREQLMQASVELGRMQATLADMGTKLPAAWTGACPGKGGQPKPTNVQESPLQAVQRAVKQLQGNLVESLQSAQKVPSSPDERHRTFSASSREPSLNSLLQGRGSQQASPVRPKRPQRQVSAPARRPSECSTSSRGAGSLSLSTRSALPRSNRSNITGEKGKKRSGPKSLASTAGSCSEDAEGREERTRKPRPPMATVLAGSSKRTPGQVLSEARRWRDAGNSINASLASKGASKNQEEQGLSENHTDSSSERLPKPTLTPVMRSR